MLRRVNLAAFSVMAMTTLATICSAQTNPASSQSNDDPSNKQTQDAKIAIRYKTLIDIAQKSDALLINMKESAEVTGSGKAPKSVAGGKTTQKSKTLLFFDISKNIDEIEKLIRSRGATKPDAGGKASKKPKAVLIFDISDSIDEIEKVIGSGKAPRPDGKTRKDLILDFLTKEIPGAGTKKTFFQHLKTESPFTAYRFGNNLDPNKVQLPNLPKKLSEKENNELRKDLAIFDKLLPNGNDNIIIFSDGHTPTRAINIKVLEQFESAPDSKRP